MPFNSATASEAGKKSKRGADQRVKVLNELFEANKEEAKKIFIILQRKAIEGDMDAIKTYMAYCYGKPEAKIDITSDGEQLGYDLNRLSTDQLKSLWEIKSSMEN